MSKEGKMKRFLTVLLILMLVMGSIVGCGGEPGGEAETFKVGAIYPLSGANALLGNQCFDAVQIAVDFINEQGGIQGKMVELIKADAPDPTAAATEAGRLVDQMGVKIIFGSLASGNALAIAGVTDKSGVVLVESGGIADLLTDSNFKYVYRILDKGGLRGAVGAEYVGSELTKELGIPAADMKVFIIHEESSYGESVANGAEAKIEEMGMQLVGREHYNTTITDMSALVLKIKDAKPDALLSVSYVNDAILLVDSLKQLQAMPKIFMGLGAGTTDPNFAMTIGADSDGFFCTDMPTNLPLDVFEDEDMRATVEAFRAAFLAKNTNLENASIAAEAAFAGAYTFMNNILSQVADLDDPESIRAAALETKLDMTTLGFGWDLGEDGQNYAAGANINQWQGGKVVTIAPAILKNGDAINIPLPIANY